MKDAHSSVDGDRTDRGARTPFVFALTAIFLESLLFSVLGPLLPDLQESLDLSSSQSGLLVGAYAVGLMVGAIPTAWLILRFGVKPCAVGGVTLLSVMGVAFAVAPSWEAMTAARAAQGLGGAVAWGAMLVWLLEAGPRDGRGATIGAGFGVAAIGQVVGPLVGGAAAVVGLIPLFAALAAIGLGLALGGVRLPAPPPRAARLHVRPALVDPWVRIAIGLVMLPAVAFGVVLTLGPLQLSDAGLEAGGIALVFTLAALAGAVIRPLAGRWADRSSGLRLFRAALGATAVAAVALALLRQPAVVSALTGAIVVVTGVCLTGSASALSEACDHVGVGQIVAMTVVSLAWTGGVVAGSVGGSALAGAVAPGAVYGVVAAVSALALATGPRRDPHRPLGSGGDVRP